MTDWRQDFRLRRWSRIDWFNLPPGEQREFYALLLALVPDMPIKNGAEWRVRKALPSEVDISLAGAAQILQLGELEAAVLGVHTPTAEWRMLRRELDELLRDAATAPEPTSGDPSLSRQSHARDAMDFLAQIDQSSAFYASEQSSAEDRVWLRGVISQIAFCAFNAGLHSQLVMDRPMEAHAVRGKDVIDGARKAAEQTNKEHEAVRRLRVSRMKELRATVKVEAAAAQCEVEGLGSAAAVKQTYYRYRHKIG